MKSISAIVQQTVSSSFDPVFSEKLRIGENDVAGILVNGILSNQNLNQMSRQVLNLLPASTRTTEAITQVQDFMHQAVCKILPQVGLEYDSAHHGVVNASLDRPLGENMMSFEQFKKIFPKLKADKAEKYFPALMQGMLEGGINTPQRQAAFLAQVKHETDGLTALAERGGASYWNQYEPNMRAGKNVGNTQTGDGFLFRGRGLLHLTGRYNYEKCGKDIGLDLVNHPELLETDISAAVKSAVWFWNKFKCTVPADKGNIDGVTKIINYYETPHAMQERRDRYIEAKTALNLE